jgi:hypothetical protein
LRNFVDFSGVSDATLAPETTCHKDFEASRYKPMNMKEMEPNARIRGKIRPESRPSLLTTCLGVLCVMGVFGVLGLLYSLG